MTVLAASDLDSWVRVRRGASAPEQDNPEVRGRLSRAWKTATATVVDRLLPDTAPWWPDIDYLDRTPYIDLRNDRMDDKWKVMNVFRVVFNPRITQREQNAFDDFVTAHRGAWNPYPHYRLGMRRWAIWELSQTGDVEHVRFEIEKACIAENTRVQLPDYFRLHPEHAVELLSSFPDMMNRRYFDGRTIRER